ncbi:spore coat associated protein CotJA [Bacillus sp. T33-2]|uniref:spore coat associated protein CotJA n=1 Tax=Bacillus sp. T33-2 TaxID=2054168 RepID=UPI000C764506|nr:spore coat associated protein CotJA [Bacillus sp. T33-2]PLR99776.1 spore coat protein CotJA [Bacillus sp. T33-2]
MHTLRKVYYPYRGRFDPCRPLPARTYSTPPNLYIGFQPRNLPQFPPREALKKGTLWKPFYDPWYSPYENGKVENLS